MPQLAARDELSDRSLESSKLNDILTTGSASAREQREAPSTPVAEKSSPTDGKSFFPAALEEVSARSTSSSSTSDLDGASSDSEDQDDAFATPDVGVLSVVLGFPVDEGEEEGEGPPPPPAVGLAVPPLLFSTPSPGSWARGCGGSGSSSSWIGGGTPRAAAAAAAARRTPRTAPGIPLDAKGRPLLPSRFALGASASKVAAAAAAAVASSALSPAATACFSGNSTSDDDGDGRGFFTAIARPMPRPVRLDLEAGEPSSDVEVFSDEEEAVVEEEARALPLCRSLFPALSPSSSSYYRLFFPLSFRLPRLATAAAFVAGCCTAYILLMRTERRAEAAARQGGGG